jgi:hypothetical protein
MCKLRPVFFVLIPMLLLWGACDGLDPSPAGGQPEPPPSPSTPEPVNPGRLVHVTGTSFSLGNGITDPYDSLFIHFDGKIVDSTIPHYDWITNVDYYYPENRKILNDTTLVLVFDGHQADCFGQANEYGFKVTGEIVFCKRVIGEMMDFQTTADGKNAFSYRREYSVSGDYSHSQIFVFDMPYLLSHCRL